MIRLYIYYENNVCKALLKDAYMRPGDVFFSAPILRVCVLCTRSADNPVARSTSYADTVDAVSLGNVENFIVMSR